MDDDATNELPLFELPVVLLPGELMPLHIFEERYKRMIAHCLEAEEPFGIVLRDDDGSARRTGAWTSS
jgi:Lon protease-like protein